MRAEKRHLNKAGIMGKLPRRDDAWSKFWSVVKMCIEKGQKNDISAEGSAKTEAQ